jgi:hypothetical protein
VDDMGCFNGSLGVEFGRVRDFEKDVFHDIRRVRNLELERLALHKYRSRVSSEGLYLP